mmetsp:Transcript_2813/g.7710  ORF Transcript_2813/g.7710 Transcript_2813/m.7710 type:complete len:300 (-) Transcript_2813:71-970(-)
MRHELHARRRKPDASGHQSNVAGDLRLARADHGRVADGLRLRRGLDQEHDGGVRHGGHRAHRPGRPRQRHGHGKRGPRRHLGHRHVVVNLGELPGVHHHLGGLERHSDMLLAPLLLLWPEPEAQKLTKLTAKLPKLTAKLPRKRTAAVLGAAIPADGALLSAAAAAVGPAAAAAVGRWRCSRRLSTDGAHGDAAGAPDGPGAGAVADAGPAGAGAAPLAGPAGSAARGAAASAAARGASPAAAYRPPVGVASAARFGAGAAAAGRRTRRGGIGAAAQARAESGDSAAPVRPTGKGGARS